MIILLLLIITTIVYIYLVYKLKNYFRMINNMAKPKDFLTYFKTYSGYIVCVDKDNVLDDPDLFKRIKMKLNKEENCTLISFDLSNREDGELIQKLKIDSIPSVLHINTDGDIKELLNFKQLTDTDSNKDILNKIKLSVAQE